MLPLTWVLICGLLGLSTLVNIIVPITGSATVTPLLSLLVEPHRAIGMATFVFFLSAPPRIFFFWKNIQWQEVRVLILPSTIAALFGALALLAVPAKFLLVIIWLFSIYFLLKKLRVIPPRKESGHIVNYVVGVLSGFLQGTGLAGSDLRNQYLYAQGLQLTEVHGTTAVIGGANFLVATLVRIYTSQLSTTDVVPLLLYVFPVIILATWIGKKTLYRLSAKTSERIVVSIMLIIVLIFTYKVFLS